MSRSTLRGHVDQVDRNRITGWAADTEASDARLEVAIVVDDREIGRVPAEIYRDDLKALGQYGDGCHGFSFTFAVPLSASVDHDIIVRLTGTERVLGKFKVCKSSVAGQGNILQAGSRSGGDRQADGSVHYVLHIGQPKTGTKYLQQIFVRFREQLLKAGICYPIEWWPQIERWQSTDMFAHNELVGELKTVPNARLQEVFDKINASGHRTVLLSCEGFCDTSQESLEYLRRLVAGNPVEVVFYARRWSDLIHSSWQQNVKEGSSETLSEFYARALAHASDNQMINQKIVLDRYSQVFGHGSVKVISYSNMQDHEQDIATNFLRDVLGWNGELILRQEQVHESMGIFLTELIRCINVLECERGDGASHRAFLAYVSVGDDPAVRENTDRIFASMQKHVGEMGIDDSAFPLQAIFAQMNEQYSDCLMNKEFGASLFERRNKRFNFVRPDFLLDDGISAAVRRVHAAVARQLTAQEAQSAA